MAKLLNKTDQYEALIIIAGLVELHTTGKSSYRDIYQDAKKFLVRHYVMKETGVNYDAVFCTEGDPSLSVKRAVEYKENYG